MSRVADQLGTGSSFDRARGGVSARRQAVAATTGVPTAGAPDSRLKTLPLEQLVPTRFNPRRNFGTDEDLLEFGLKLKKKQLQPAVAVTRDAYLELWPDEVAHLGTAKYVIANGERRYRGSFAAGLITLEVVVDDDIAASRADFLDAVLSENNDREDLDPIERALGIKTMVEQLGGKAIVAEHYNKSGGWVTQQMYLLDLAPELQQLVSSGALPVRETRELVKLPPEDQMSAWRARAAEREEEKAQPRPARRKKAPFPSPERAGGDSSKDTGTFTAVKNLPSPDEQSGSDAQGFTAVKPAGESSAPSVPDRRPGPVDLGPPAPSTVNGVNTLEAQGSEESTAGEAGQPRRLPYDDAFSLVTHLHLKMEPAVFAEGARVWLRILREQHPDAYDVLLQELPQQEQPA